MQLDRLYKVQRARYNTQTTVFARPWVHSNVTRRFIQSVHCANRSNRLARVIDHLSRSVRGSIWRAWRTLILQRKTWRPSRRQVRRGEHGLFITITSFMVCALTDLLILLISSFILLRLMVNIVLAGASSLQKTAWSPVVHLSRRVWGVQICAYVGDNTALHRMWQDRMLL